VNLIAELKRRNVIRVAGLYLVGAWLITQVSSTVLPLYDAPAWLRAASEGCPRNGRICDDRAALRADRGAGRCRDDDAREAPSP
jgi:hypothetical protein